MPMAIETSVKDPMGRITTTQYDEMDRPVVVIDPMGNRVTTTYDADGEKLTVTDALNETTTYTYSVRGWVATVTDPMGYIVTYTYSATGMNLAAYQTMFTQFEADANTYDADDRLIARKTASARPRRTRMTAWATSPVSRTRMGISSRMFITR